MISATAPAAADIRIVFVSFISLPSCDRAPMVAIEAWTEKEVYTKNLVVS